MDIWRFVGNLVQNLRVCVSVPLNFGFFPRRCAAVAFFFFFFPPSEFPSRNKLQHPLPPTTKTARLRRDSPIEPKTLNSCLNYPRVLAKPRRGVARWLMVGKSRIGRGGGDNNLRGSRRRRDVYGMARSDRN